MPLKLGELDVLSTKIFFKAFDKSKSRQNAQKEENAQVRSVSFWEPIVALNQISQHHHREV